MSRGREWCGGGNGGGGGGGAGGGGEKGEAGEAKLYSVGTNKQGVACVCWPIALGKRSRAPLPFDSSPSPGSGPKVITPPPPTP